MDLKRSVLYWCVATICLSPVLAQAGAANGSTDEKFVTTAAQTDMLEAHLGQMAMDRAASQAVKAYAQMLVTDHTSDYQQLSAIATKAGLTVPKGLDTLRNREIKPFDKLKGSVFDRRFAREMITGHTKAIAEYRHEGQSGTSTEIKAYTKQTLPTLEKHLHEAEALEKRKK